MSVVIDQVVGRVEPAPGTAAGQTAGPDRGEAPQPPPGKPLRVQLERLERRRHRLEAD